MRYFKNGVGSSNSVHPRDCIYLINNQDLYADFVITDVAPLTVTDIGLDDVTLTINWPPLSYLASLTRSALVDDYRSIRDRSLDALKKINDENTATYFAPRLHSNNPHVRTRAANAISIFPNRAAVPELLITMRKTWVG